MHLATASFKKEGILRYYLRKQVFQGTILRKQVFQGII